MLYCLAIRVSVSPLFILYLSHCTSSTSSSDESWIRNLSAMPVGHGDGGADRATRWRDAGAAGVQPAALWSPLAGECALPHPAAARCAAAICRGSSLIFGQTPKPVKQPTAHRSLFRYAVEIFLAAEEELFAGDRRGAVEFLVEFVGGEHLEFGAVFQHGYPAVSAGDVNFSGRAHG